MRATSTLVRIIVILAAVHLVSVAFADPPCFRGMGAGVDSLNVTGLCADGTVAVGNSYSGWRWTSSEGFQYLQNLPGGSPATAYAISGDGLSIVGRFDEYQQYEWQPMRWTAGVGAMPLTFVPGWTNYGSADGVSSDGLVIVGQAYAPESTYLTAFRWDPIGGMQSLGYLPGGEISSARGVSADGAVIVGESRYDGNILQQAFRWTQETGMVPLGFLPGHDRSYANAVSADGTTAVGASCTEGSVEACRWSEGEDMMGLGWLPGGEQFSQAKAVSADGAVIVGTASNYEPGSAFVWDAQHGMRSLQEVVENDYGLDLSGWDLGEATGVSADGNIVVGKGLDPDGPDAWLVRLAPVTGTCPGDLDFDGDVDVHDLAELLSVYGEDAAGDLDCDRATGLSDLSILLANYGTTCE